MKTWKLVSPRSWITSYVARSGHGMLVITLITITGSGGSFDKKLQEPALHPILSLSIGDDLMILLIG